MRQLATGLMLIVGLVGCRPSAPTEALYPMLDRLQGPFDFVLSLEATRPASPENGAVVEALAKATVHQMIGAAEGQGPEYFLGRVVYATFDPKGRLVVVDWDNGEVRFFDRAGRFLFKVGRKGLGPGEFDQPIYVAFDSRGWLYVMEEGRPRLHRYRPEGTGFVLDQTYNLGPQLQASPLGWCLLEDTLYVYTQSAQWEKQPLFRVLTLEGRPVRSFGRQDVYSPEALPEGFGALMLEAQLYCDPYGPGLLLVYRNLPVAVYYSTDGTRRWRVRIGEAPLLAYRLVEGGRLQPTLRDRGYVLRNVWPLPDGRVLFHLVYQERRSRQPLAARTIASYAFWLDPARQQWYGQEVTFPFFRLYTWQGAYGLGISPASELPHVAVFRLPEPISGS
ncbi:6-bladed beta-propeller [Rhodothermus profundi]|uniref:6-bladed beta-propeller protein n=1 Tax=Rhodothermus profundi TaxID=633813 RepID=A0A1M6VVC1_9BACT|nr:6-bladed beta-propeller [Rhodothermus profundi]SHK85492.1 hypothetical protein SAMN04488087_2131 [Rhodothermus profundi]